MVAYLVYIDETGCHPSVRLKQHQDALRNGRVEKSAVNNMYGISNIKFPEHCGDIRQRFDYKKDQGPYIHTMLTRVNILCFPPS